MNLIKTFFLFFSGVNSQLLGANNDPSGNGCVTDGGYQWCEEINSCVRTWETPCLSLNNNYACNNSICPEILFRCPEPELKDIDLKKCRIITPQDICGCQTGCPSYDCSNTNDLSTCLIEYNNSPQMPGSFVPQCDNDGNYKSMQCHGSIGSCWCSDTDGNEIDNTRTMCRGNCNLNEAICQSVQNNNVCRTDDDCHNDQFCRISSSQLRRPCECIKAPCECPQLNEPLLGGRRLQDLNNRLQPLSICVDKSDEGNSCGGYTLPEYVNRCKDELECVNTMGPMIADAPGQCKIPCDEGILRDDYGNCINTIKIPDNCATWFDGCNTCQVRDGKANICTLMYCFTQNKPKCMNFYSNTLNLNDICYRFCEDNSEKFIDKKDSCPGNSQCISSFNKNSVSMIAFDSCNDRAWTCQNIEH